MGRKSKLTDEQWQQIGERLVKGEKPADLAREFKVSKATISERFSKRTEKIKAVAGQLVAAETAFESLGIAEQISARSLADDLKAISAHLASAAKYGAQVAHKLAGIANEQAQQVDDARPEESVDNLKRIDVMMTLANKSANLGLNLLAANKEAAKAMIQEDPVLPVKVVVQVQDAGIPEP